MCLDDFCQRLCQLGMYLGERGLAWGSSGNISLRVDPDRFLISASGTWLGRLTPQQVTLCHLHSETYLGAKPSVETPMHRAIYRVRRDAGVVIHVSPLYTTLIACSDLDIPSALNVENVFYVGRVCRLPYIQPGTHQLAEAVAQAAREHETIILSNHGMITFHTTVEEALMRVESVETSCRLVVVARMAGVSLNHLSPEQVEQLLGVGGYRRHEAKD